MNYIFGRRRKSTTQKVAGLVAENTKNNCLILDQTGLTDESTIELATILEGQVDTLEHLSLMDNKIGDKGALKLADVLKRMKKLQSVHLDGNFIGKEGVHSVCALANAFCCMKNVKSIGLSYNRISKEGVKVLASVIRMSKTLERIELGGNFDPPLGAYVLASEALCKCESIRQIIYSPEDFRKLPEYSKVSLEMGLRKALNSNKKVKTHSIDLHRGEILITYKNNADLENEKRLNDLQANSVEAVIWEDDMTRHDVQKRMDMLIRKLQAKMSDEPEPQDAVDFDDMDEDNDSYVFYTDPQKPKRRHSVDRGSSIGVSSMRTSRSSSIYREDSMGLSMASTGSTASVTDRGSYPMDHCPYTDRISYRSDVNHVVLDEIYDDGDDDAMTDDVEAWEAKERQDLREVVLASRHLEIDMEDYEILDQCSPSACVFRVCKSKSPKTRAVVKLFIQSQKPLADHEAFCLRVLKSTYVIKLQRATVQKVSITNDLWCWGIILQEGRENLLSLSAQVQQMPGYNPDNRDENFRKFFSDAVRPVLLSLQHMATKGFICSNLKLEHVVAIDQGILSYYSLVDLSCSTKYEDPIPLPTEGGEEYCPPEMARYLCSPSNHLPPRAYESYDIWTFGVFMLKLIAGERALLEFKGHTKRQILRRIACPNFCFEDSVNAYVKYEAVKRLIRLCLNRDPAERPTASDLLADPLIGHALPTALISRLDLEKLVVDKHYETQSVVMQRKAVQLPTLFLLAPPAKRNSDGKVVRRMKELLHDECELRFVCEAFNRGFPCSLPDDAATLQIKKPGKIFVKAAPVIMGTCTFLKLIGMVAMVPGSPLGALIFLKSVSDLELYAESILRHRLDNQTKEQIKELVERAKEFQGAAGGQSVGEAIAKLRSACMTAEGRQTLLQSLRAADEKVDWERQFVIGGLRKVQLLESRRAEAGGAFEHWVCAQHAQDSGWYVQP